MAQALGVEVEVLSGKDLNSGSTAPWNQWPDLYTEDVVGAIYIPKDAITNPVDTTMALAKGAKAAGALLFEETRVTDVLHEKSPHGGRRTLGVVTDRGEIRAPIVVNCGGLWARQLGLLADVVVPLHGAEHSYVVTEPIESLPQDLPTLRDFAGRCYFRRESGGKLLIGFFEQWAKPWGQDGVPHDLRFAQLAPDWQHLEPELKAMCHRLPALDDTGLELLFNGPESFTPDDRYLLGEAPNLDGFFVAAGFNSIGIQSAGGVGRALSDWIANGHAPCDLWDVELARMQPHQNHPSYLFDRTKEGLGLLYDVHWPYRQHETSRDQRLSPVHELTKKAGACFSVSGGWERPSWFAREGQEPKDEYSYGPQNWFTNCAEECKATRERVGLFDQSSFSKTLVHGKGSTSATRIRLR